MSEYQVTPEQEQEQKWREEYTAFCSATDRTYLPELCELWQAARAIDAKRIAELEAQVDRLMLEYCPDEMTPAQIENWGNHQKVSSFKLTNTTLPVLTWETAKRKGE